MNNLKIILFAEKISNNQKNFDINIESSKENNIIYSTYFFNSEFVNAQDLFDFLNKNIKKLTNHYSKIEIDISSFFKVGFKKIDNKYLSWIIYSIVNQINNFPYSLKNKKEVKEKKIQVINVKGVDLETENLIHAEKECKIMQELPPNLMRPLDFVEKAKKLFENSSIKIKLISGEEIKKQNLNLIDKVGSATQDQNCLLICEYIGNPNNEKKISLIGKGVCYDSGGLNIKTGSYMSNMKFDMSGAAVSLSTLYALEKNKKQVNVILFIPLVENLINEKSYKSDDVIISHSGLSVEINNTDAEGRLILADAISYSIKKYSPDLIITIATLTGAIGYALGYKYAGVWCSSDKDWNILYKSSLQVGDYIWRMPLHDYYLDGLKSSIADISNSAKSGAGGASRAAMFLKSFAKKNQFIHIDIANVSHQENNGIANAPLLRTLYNGLTEFF